MLNPVETTSHSVEANRAPGTSSFQEQVGRLGATCISTEAPATIKMKAIGQRIQCDAKVHTSPAPTVSATSSPVPNNGPTTITAIVIVLITTAPAERPSAKSRCFSQLRRSGVE